MSTHNDHDYVLHILESIDKIDHYIGNLSHDEFVKDDKTVDAVIRQFMILGEAASRVSGDFRENHPEIPWHLATGMRNQLVHGYLEVDTEVVWETAIEDLPQLKKQLSSF